MSARTVTAVAARRGHACDIRPMKPPSSPTWLRVLVLLLPAMAAGGCAAIDAMPGTEKAWHTLHLIDTLQTLNGPAADRCYRETAWDTRALIGEQPSREAALAWAVGMAVAHYAASRMLERAELPPALEVVIRGVDLGYKAGTVAVNHNAGIRPWGDNVACHRGAH